MAMVSCSQNEWGSEKDSSFSATRADEWVVDYETLDTACYVNENDIEAYIHFKQLLAKGKGKEFEVLEVAPLGLDDRATLCYLLNYNEGWEIIAADKRAPVVLATGETGIFSLEEAPDNVMAWIEGLENDVLYLRTFVGRPETADDETWDKMLSTMDFWKAINADEEFIERNSKPQTRSVPDTLPLDPPGGDEPFPFLGHWVLVSSTSVTEPFDSIGRLTRTSWHQHEPYNQFCPYTSNSFTEHALAGCSAVAAAQMEYFLHYKIGFPIYAPDGIHCTATINDYNLTNYYTFGNNDTIWNYMRNDDNPLTQNNIGEQTAAILISDAGIEMEIDYGINNTSAGDNDVVNFLNSKGIYCVQNGYVPSVVCDHLLSGMPVVMSAKRTKITIMGINYYTDGHYFIIDRYKRSRQKITNTYEWVYDDTGGLPAPPINDKIEITYSSPFFSAISMNWGLQTEYPYHNYNNDYYSLSGDWEIETYNYQYVRKMITGYSH